MEFGANFMNEHNYWTMCDRKYRGNWKVKSQDEVSAVLFTMVIRFLGTCVTSAIILV